MMNKNYVWHCPNFECREKGIVIIKTTIPYLGEGVIHCPRCGNEYSFFEIMRANKKNIELFLTFLSSF